jgi:hypothetical protein
VSGHEQVGEADQTCRGLASEQQDKIGEDFFHPRIRSEKIDEDACSFAWLLDCALIPTAIAAAAGALSP